MMILGKEVELKEKCWKGYEKKGMKTMFGKRYPNCVKKEEVEIEEKKMVKVKLTGGGVEARDEISSSIRYAARLQNALLPKSFPGDFTINVEWRPRDLVGGDIYFVKDLPDKVYIAVVDCTGHGVPGAFLSIIARSQLEKAIDEEHYQSACLLYTSPSPRD